MKFLMIIICLCYSSLSFSMTSSAKKELSNRWEIYLLENASITCAKLVMENCSFNQMANIESQFLDLKDINAYNYGNKNHNLVIFFHDRAYSKFSPKEYQKYYKEKLISLVAKISISEKEYKQFLSKIDSK